MTLGQPAFSFEEAYTSVFLRRAFYSSTTLLAWVLICDRLFSFFDTSLRDLVFIGTFWGLLTLCLAFRLAAHQYESTVHLRAAYKWLALYAKWDHWILMATYSLGMMLVTHLAVSLAIPSWNLSLRIFIPNQRLDIPQLNLDALFIWSLGSMLGKIVSWRRILSERWVIRPTAVRQPVAFHIKANLMQIITEAWTISLFTLGTLWLVFMLFGGSVYSSMSQYTRYFFTILESPIIGFHWWHLFTLWRLLMIGSVLVFSFMLVDVLADGMFANMDQCIFEVHSGFNALPLIISSLAHPKNGLVKSTALSALTWWLPKSPQAQQLLFQSTYQDPPFVEFLKVVDKELLAISNRIKDEFKKDQKPAPADAAPSDATSAASSALQPPRIQLVDKNVYARRRHGHAKGLDDRTGRLASTWAATAEKWVPSPDVPLRTYVLNVVADTCAYIADLTAIGPAKTIALHFQHTKRRQMAHILTPSLDTIRVLQLLQVVIAVSVLNHVDENDVVRSNLTQVVNMLLAFEKQLDDYLKSPPAHYKLYADAPAESDIKLRQPAQLKRMLNDTFYLITQCFPEDLETLAVDEPYRDMWTTYLSQQ
ncbi:hypothetical protein BC940DRAFT_305039 [Gongronella butleri]|nr:hypothetical protein BC940DRAFT_305039 [Gongronella butleri]